MSKRIVKLLQNRECFIRGMANKYYDCHCSDLVESEIIRECDIYNLNTGHNVKHTDVYDFIINEY